MPDMGGDQLWRRSTPPRATRCSWSWRCRAPPATGSWVRTRCWIERRSPRVGRRRLH